MAQTIQHFGGTIGTFMIVIVAAGVIAITAMVVYTIYKGAKTATRSASSAISTM
jgi:flagellar basal body-associated protein FliL